MPKILIVEDDQTISKLIAASLSISGYESVPCFDGNEAVHMVRNEEFDLILLDIMLPGLDGFQVMEKIRETGTPVIFLTAMGDVSDRVKGLKSGAEDYIVKPFSPAELVARVKAHIGIHERLLKKGREKEAYEKAIEVRGLRIDAGARRVFVRGEEVALTNKEFELLLFLAENPNIAFSKETLFDRVWGLDAVGDTATVTVHVNRLREKLEDGTESPDYIETVWGVGYRFRI